jgi:hypothetical protein
VGKSWARQKERYDCNAEEYIAAEEASIALLRAMERSCSKCSLVQASRCGCLDDSSMFILVLPPASFEGVERDRYGVGGHEGQ